MGHKGKHCKKSSLTIDSQISTISIQICDWNTILGTFESDKLNAILQDTSNLFNTITDFGSQFGPTRDPSQIGLKTQQI